MGTEVLFWRTASANRTLGLACCPLGLRELSMASMASVTKWPTAYFRPRISSFPLLLLKSAYHASLIGAVLLAGIFRVNPLKISGRVDKRPVKGSHLLDNCAVP